MEVSHRIETLSHFIARIRLGDTPRRLTWVVMVIDEEGRVLSSAERARILRSLGIETETPNEVDVYDWL